METKVNTGGPAFPFVDCSSPLEHPGMTLRDYFAAKAMQVLCDDRFTEDQIANAAYLLADAMIKARGQ